MSKIYDFCGNELPPHLMSTKNLLTLDYVVKNPGLSSNLTKNDGFLLEYRFINNYGNQSKEAIINPNSSKRKFFFKIKNANKN